MSNDKLLVNITRNTIVLNILLSFFKVIVGIFGRSSVLIADGIHSASDVITTIVAFIGVKIAGKSDDEDHQYGHEKLEPVMSKLLAIFLFVTAVFLAYNAFKNIQAANYSEPSVVTLVIAVVSIVVKEWMYRYTLKGSLILESSALKADAWHHRSDAFSSVAAVVGIGGAMMGYFILEPIVTIGISAFIMKISVDIYIESVKELIDTAVDSDTLKEIKFIVNEVNGVLSIDLLKTRLHASKIYVDIEIGVEESLSLKEAHCIAESVHNQLETKNKKIKHCMVHVNPVKRT
ncbi:cation diffusion facilitator family transporter [Helicovermis profundi]|uniref:Cation diffusion facilitator family transporter n=1 Tax=Helicovermis profundi TaxID=3065157 RepID=A0AAU9E1W5_9FIRM|nr:cation diffusion facilitator family transporter [Clostridia bacterium S502]